MAAPGPRRSAGGTVVDIGAASLERVGGSVLGTVMVTSLGRASSRSNSTTEPNSEHMARLLRIRKGKSSRGSVHRARAGRGASKEGATDEHASWKKEPDPTAAAIERAVRGLGDRSPASSHMTTVRS